MCGRFRGMSSATAQPPTEIAGTLSPLHHRPFTLLGIFPVGGRSTAIRLQSGDVWILASTPLNDETKQKLAELGEVKYDTVSFGFTCGSLRAVQVYCRGKRLPLPLLEYGSPL